MATPDNPDDKAPDGRDPCDELDRQIGFASPDHLRGESRPAPSPEPTAAPVEPEPPLETPRSQSVPDAPPPPPEPSMIAGPEPVVAVAPPSRPPVRRRDEIADTPEGIRAVTLYALILFAVPTLGVSAVIGILAVMGREAPSDPLAGSHFIFQKRTLWGAALAAGVGLILIVVNLGVFVLFLAAVWTLIRGAVGVFKLKAARPIDNPMTPFL
ncbi:DUF4870 family protein [Brevundimonas balnearis]|uniref:DUF4870 family protein n=1 Tax=Brevundimonas balnearis TaxID=1572858 RepID=A0ABV6R019_9CAUL